MTQLPLSDDVKGDSLLLRLISIGLIIITMLQFRSMMCGPGSWAQNPFMHILAR